jgi:3'-5' exoribonuclease
MISDLVLGDSITDFFVLASAQLIPYDRGERLRLELSDCSGRIEGVVWDAAAGVYNEIKDSDVVKVKGTVSSYRDRLQIKVERIRSAKEDEYDIGALMPVVPGGIEEQRELFDEVASTVTEPFLSELLRLFRSDSELFERFLNSPAGKKFHHNYIGGLAQHSLSMAALAIKVCERYPELDRDLVVCGAVFHDIGKIEELSSGFKMDYTSQGRLVGHIILGDEVLTSIISQIPDFPEMLEQKLRHLIASHHGEKEFGSPVVPVIREAWALHHIDKIDSGLNVFDRVEAKTDDGWSDWVRLWDRYLFFG